MAEDWIAKKEADPNFKDKVATMDESWVSHFMPETKQQSKVGTNTFFNQSTEVKYLIF